MSDSSDLEDPPLPPVTESQADLMNELVAQLEKQIRLGMRVLKRDSSGCVQTIQRQNSLQEWMEHLTVQHRWISTNTSVLQPGADGDCIEGRHFKIVYTVEGEVDDGENKVLRAEGKNAGVQHILKLIPDRTFRPEEVLAHDELQHGCDDISKLMLVRKDGDKWALHFELVPEGEMLSEVCKKIEPRVKMDPEFVPLVPQFALCCLYFMLKVWQYIRQKKWAHMDLTGENILISKETLQVVVIDFGLAERLGDNVSSNMISDWSEQDYADIMHRFTELTEAMKCTEIITGNKKKRTTFLFGRCQEITNQHGEGYASPDKALRLSQIQQLLFPGEVAFRCFLEAMVLKAKDTDSLMRLKGLLEGPLEGNNLAAILDMHRKEIGLLIPEDVQRIHKILQKWGVLDHGPCEQFFERLKQAVSGTTDLDYGNIPSHVLQVINVALEVKMTSIIKKTMSELFPAYYEKRAVDGQQPVGETSQQGDTEVPRQAPVAASLPRPSQREIFQAPVAGGQPLSSQHLGPQVAVVAQHPSDPPSASEEKPEAVGGEEAKAATLTGDQSASSEGAVDIRKENT